MTKNWSFFFSHFFSSKFHLIQNISELWYFWGLIRTYLGEIYPNMALKVLYCMHIGSFEHTNEEKNASFWSIMIPHGASWLPYIVEYYDALRCITMHYDALRCITRHYEAIWGHMRPYEAIWGRMRPPGRHHTTVPFMMIFSVFLFFVFCSNKWKCTRNASLLRSNSTVSHQNTFKFDLRSDALRLYFHWFDKKKKKNKKKKKEKKSSWMVPHTVHHAVLMWPCMPS